MTTDHALREALRDHPGMTVEQYLNRQAAKDDDQVTVDSPQYRALYARWLREGGEMSGALHDELLRSSAVERELRDLGVSADNVGGFVVPPHFTRLLYIGLKRGSAMFRAGTVVESDTGQVSEVPLFDDTSVNGAIVSEAAPHTIDSTTPFASRALSSYLYSSQIVKLSRQLATDSAFPFETWLPRVLGARIGRGFNAHGTTGSGGGTQPAGLVPATTVGVTGGAGTGLTITYDDLVALIASVDADYLEPDPDLPGHIGFMGRTAALTMLRKVRDTANAPIAVTNNDGVTRVLGYPWVTNRDMAAPAINARSLLFGNFAAGVLVRRVRGPLVLFLQETYAATAQLGWIGFERLDSVQADAAALRVYVNGPS